MKLRHLFETKFSHVSFCQYTASLVSFFIRKAYLRQCQHRHPLEYMRPVLQHREIRLQHVVEFVGETTVAEGRANRIEVAVVYADKAG